MLKLTVVIPSYNGARYIQAAIASVFDQTSPVEEIIVVDDCSTDGTVMVVRETAAASPIPIRVIQLEVNSGSPAHPINVGVEAAETEFIAVLDQDDVYASDIMERVMRAFNAAPECSMVFYWVGNYDDVKRKPRQSDSLRAEIATVAVEQNGVMRLPAQALTPFLISAGMFAYGYPGFVFRKSCWKQKGGVDESLRIASDMEFFSYLAQHGPVALIPTVGYLRREHESNVSNNTSRMFYEIGLVTGRMVSSVDRPPSDSRLVKLAADKIFDLAFWFREAHYYPEATKLYQLAGQVSQDRIKALLALLKLQIHRLRTNLFRREPVFSVFTRNRTQ